MDDDLMLALGLDVTTTTTIATAAVEIVDPKVAQAAARMRFRTVFIEDSTMAGNNADRRRGGGDDDARIVHRRRGMREDAFDRENEGIVPIDRIAWQDAPHILTRSRCLTAADPRAPDPVGFKGRLFDPQKTLLAAMVALERRPVLTITDPKADPRWDPTLQSKIARVSARFSFGKTVATLAHICAQRVPARLPEMVPLLSCGGGNDGFTNFANVNTDVGAHTYNSIGEGFYPEVTARYGRYLPLTVVAAAANVITQWVDNTVKFTNLKYFVIEHVRSLRDFETKYRAGEIGMYDLIFVKAGRVTTNFVLEGETARTGATKNRSLFEALARVLEGVPVARLVIDDYDTLKLSNDDCYVPALFTWLISATRRQTTASARIESHTQDTHMAFTTAEQFMRANMATTLPILSVALDDVINKVFSLHCDSAYVDDHISSFRVTYRRIFVAGGAAAAMLRDLDVAEEIVEMVNADAAGAAGSALGIEAKSPGDLVKRVVGGHLGKLRHAIRALERVEAARVTLAARRGAVEHDREIIKTLRAALKDGTDEEVDAATNACGAAGKDVTFALDSLDEWATEQRDKYNKTLLRMRANIREGQCQSCMVPFEKGDDAAYVLTGCCQIIVCEPCIARKEGNRKVFIKRCPNCAVNIKITGGGLVRVGAELDLDAALSDDIVAASEIDTNTAADPAAAMLVTDAFTSALKALNNPKLMALIQFLVRGTGVVAPDHQSVPSNAQPIDCLNDHPGVAPYVEGLLDGRRDADWPAAANRKYLVFTVHTESTQLIAQTLTQLGIGHCILRGSRQQKDEVVRTLKNNVGIMLVTSPKDSGGLDLPWLSDIVFYHRVVDRNVEAQVAARGQRLGRTANLSVTTFLNETEAAAL